jgi:hypothetical protein
MNLVFLGGINIVLSIHLSFELLQAIMGGTVDVPTLSGKMQLKVTILSFILFFFLFNIMFLSSPFSNCLTFYKQCNE